MTGSAQPDWQRIRRLYVAGARSLAAIAEQYGVSVQRITRRARNEGWPPRRRRASGAREGPIRKRNEESAATHRSEPATARLPTKRHATAAAATTLKARRALVRRLYKAIDTKLKQMERRMAHDMATTEGPSDTTAADHERDTRAIGSLIANLSRVTEIEADLERHPGAASPAEQQGAQHAEQQLADEAERFRRDVAERLARLVRPT